jgi:phenylacetate-CoA ligase
VARKRIEQSFKIPVLSNYGTVECLKIGFECGRQPGFHIHEDICHVQIIKDDGDEALPGEKGEVVISNLMNRGSVLLNYRLGDLASLTQEHCRCGRTTHKLSELEGRTEDIIQLEDGKLVHPRSVWSVFKKEPRVRQYQLIQLSPSQFDLKLVTASESNFGEVNSVIGNALKSLLGDQVKIRTEKAEQLSREKSGKFRPVKSICGPGAGKGS